MNSTASLSKPWWEEEDSLLCVIPNNLSKNKVKTLSTYLEDGTQRMQ